MAPSSNRQERSFDFSREEQWVLHHAMLDRMEMEAQSPADTDPPPIAAYRAFEKLEAGTHRFSRCERRCLRDELRRCVETSNMPERDQSIAKRLLDRLQWLESASSAVEPLQS